MLATGFVNAELGVATAEEVPKGARRIVAELISERVDLRKALRQLVYE
jgi:transcriptional accessory protein Tex/SPT6